MKNFSFHYLLISFLFLSCQSEPLELANIDIQKKGGIGWKEKEACSIIYSSNGSVDTLSGKIKNRGGISRRYYKHSFSLELDEAFSFTSLPEDDDWIINANYIDKTFMRHKVSYDLFNEMNAQNIAAQCAYVNLSINSKYEGLYVLMEEVNASMIGLNKSDSMAMLWKDPPIFKKERLPFVQDSLNYYQQKYPKINVKDNGPYLEEFMAFLNDSSDEDFIKNISAWVDLENVMDWHIILLFTNNGEGLLKNFYLYKVDEATPFRFAIWDYDHSFGRDGDNEMNFMEREINCNRAVLLERLMTIKGMDYFSQLKERWHELRTQNIISVENIEDLIEQNHGLIVKDVDRNFEKWPIDSKWYFDDQNYVQEVDLMRKFVRLRIDQLDAYFQ